MIIKDMEKVSDFGSLEIWTRVTTESQLGFPMKVTRYYWRHINSGDFEGPYASSEEAIEGFETVEKVTNATSNNSNF